MFKFGLEKEYFVLNSDGAVSVCPSGLPYDESGILAEARGLPDVDIINAVFSLRTDCYRLNRTTVKYGYSLLEKPIMKVGRDIKLEASRYYAKGLTSYQNLYGHKRHKNTMSEHTAGLHLSITNVLSTSVRLKKGEYKEVEYYGMWDFVQFFRYLDKAFYYEIAKSKRNPGFYEIKCDGRVEYRSLPNNVDLDKLINAVLEFFRKNLV